MSPETREAIDEARDNDDLKGAGWSRGPRSVPFGLAVRLLYKFAQNVPSDMTMAELCDELCNANNQNAEGA